jgi:hypothetical protein
MKRKQWQALWLVGLLVMAACGKEGYIGDVPPEDYVTLKLPGDTLYVMKYNLMSSNQIKSDTTPGDLWQWSRASDGHEKRSNGNMAPHMPVPYSDLDANGQPNTAVWYKGTDGDWRNYGGSHTDESYEYAEMRDWLWNYRDENGKLHVNKSDPCPKGWHVPSAEEWKMIAAGGEWTLDSLGAVVAIYQDSTKLIFCGSYDERLWNYRDGRVWSPTEYWASSALDENSTGIVFSTNVNKDDYRVIWGDLSCMPKTCVRSTRKKIRCVAD